MKWINLSSNDIGNWSYELLEYISNIGVKKVILKNIKIEENIRLLRNKLKLNELDLSGSMVNLRRLEV